jgi:single-stranded DNA-binding protein
MSTSILISGRLGFNPEIKQTRNEKLWARILVETAITREARKGEFVTESTLLPINCFARCAHQVKDLAAGAQLTVGCHLSGTKFDSNQGPRYGVQLIADVVYIDASDHKGGSGE